MYNKFVAELVMGRVCMGRVGYGPSLLWAEMPSYRRKIGQGHSRVIIYINYDGQESPMLHTKFRENQPAGSGEEDFEWFLPYMGMAAILVM